MYLPVSVSFQCKVRRIHIRRVSFKRLSVKTLVSFFEAHAGRAIFTDVSHASYIVYELNRKCIHYLLVVAYPMYTGRSEVMGSHVCMTRPANLSAGTNKFKWLFPGLRIIRSPPGR